MLLFSSETFCSGIWHKWRPLPRKIAQHKYGNINSSSLALLNGTAVINTKISTKSYLHHVMLRRYMPVWEFNGTFFPFCNGERTVNYVATRKVEMLICNVHLCTQKSVSYANKQVGIPNQFYNETFLSLFWVITINEHAMKRKNI